MDPAAPALVHSGSERDSDGSSLPEPSDEESSASDFSAADSAENDGKRRRRRPAPAAAAPAAAAATAGPVARPPVQAQPATAAQARPAAPGGAAAARPLAQAQARALAPAPAAAAQPVPPLRTGGKHGLPLRIFGLGAAERQKFAAARPLVPRRPAWPAARATAPRRQDSLCAKAPGGRTASAQVLGRRCAGARPGFTEAVLGACCALGGMKCAGLCACAHAVMSAAA